MGIFKKTEKETIYDDYDDESYRDEELLEEADKEKAANKMFNILNIYETFDKKNKKKHEDRKSGELDEKTKEKQQQAKIEEEKYDHLLNSMQAQTLIKAVEKYGKDEEERKEIDAIPIELPKEKSELDKIAEYAMSRNIDSVNIKDFSTHDIEVYVREQCDIMEEAATHVENAKAEYEAVTEEYNDIQIMEEAPTQIRDKILSCAETIDNMMVDRRILKSTEHKLSNAAYRRMEAVENEMPGGIKLLKASEDYYDTVKRDLRILEAEQLNLRTDADVLVTRQIKIRRLAKTAIFALAAVFAVFLISMTLVQNDSDTALFIGISLFAAILAVGMFALLKGPCGIDYKISNFFSVAIAICFAFVVNKLYVFQSKSESFADTIHEFIKFVLGRLVTMAVEVGGVPFCVEILHQPQMIAKLETQVIVTIVNYFISKFLVFKSQKK